MNNNIRYMPGEVLIRTAGYLKQSDKLSMRLTAKAPARAAESALTEEILRLKNVRGLKDILNITPRDSLKNLDASEAGVSSEDINMMLDEGHRFRHLAIKDHSASESTIQRIISTQKHAEVLDLSVSKERAEKITLSASAFPAMQENHSLKKLNLSGLILEPDCFKELSKCPALEEINLSATGLTRESLEAFRPIKGALKNIDISGNPDLSVESVMEAFLTLLHTTHLEELHVSPRQLATQVDTQRQGFLYCIQWSLNRDFLQVCRERNIKLFMHTNDGKVYNGSRVFDSGILSISTTNPDDLN